MDLETKITINFLDNNPKGLSQYLEKRYGNLINKIIRKLEKYFREDVDLYYTYENLNFVFSSDLDFYLVNNKGKYPIVSSGSRKLPVCFVINPPCYKTPKSDKWIVRDEGIHLVTPFSKENIKWLYRSKVDNVNWKRLFDKALEVKLE